MAKIELLMSISSIHIPPSVFPIYPPCSSSQYLPRCSGHHPSSHPWFILFSQIPNIQTINKSHLFCLQNAIWIGPLLSISPATALEAATMAFTSSTVFMFAYPIIHSFTQQPEWSFINIKQIGSLPTVENPLIASLCVWNKIQNSRLCIWSPSTSPT